MGKLIVSSGYYYQILSNLKRYVLINSPIKAFGLRESLHRVWNDDPLSLPEKLLVRRMVDHRVRRVREQERVAVVYRDRFTLKKVIRLTSYHEPHL